MTSFPTTPTTTSSSAAANDDDDVTGEDADAMEEPGDFRGEDGKVASPAGGNEPAIEDEEQREDSDQVRLGGRDQGEAPPTLAYAGQHTSKS